MVKEKTPGPNIRVKTPRIVEKTPEIIEKTPPVVDINQLKNERKKLEDERRKLQEERNQWQKILKKMQKYSDSLEELEQQRQDKIDDIRNLEKDLKATKREHNDLQDRIDKMNRDKDRIKDEYVFRVTHDIKGHLAAIQSCIDVVANELVGPLNEQQSEFINRAIGRTRGPSLLPLRDRRWTVPAGLGLRRPRCERCPSARGPSTPRRPSCA